VSQFAGREGALQRNDALRLSDNILENVRAVFPIQSLNNRLLHSPILASGTFTETIRR
jgi:hypothetical protein